MSTANWTVRDSRIVSQPIDYADTAQNHAPGTIVKAKSATYGEGEFIYLPGVASTAVGSVVTYDAYNAATTLAPSTANLGKPLAVAMAAAGAGQWGWYQGDCTISHVPNRTCSR